MARRSRFGHYSHRMGWKGGARGKGRGVPSFSRSSLSTTTTNFPCAMAAAAASTVDHIERPEDKDIARCRNSG